MLSSVLTPIDLSCECYLHLMWMLHFTEDFLQGPHPVLVTDSDLLNACC